MIVYYAPGIYINILLMQHKQEFRKVADVYIEQILTLRLLIENARLKKKKLFILFVDFQKAYDKVPTGKMMECLRNNRCASNMLKAIHTLYKETKFTLRSATVDANTGVRQGAPTSCLLFTLYADVLRQMLNARHTAKLSSSFQMYYTNCICRIRIHRQILSNCTFQP